MRYFLILFLCLVLSQAEGQGIGNKAFIRIRVTSGNLQRGEFTTDIYRNGGELKMVYTFRDSLSRAYYSDKRYSSTRLSLNNLAEGIQEERNQILAAMEELEKEYSFYSRDSLWISISKVPFLDSLISQVVKTPSENLEDREAIKKQGGVLDGAYYTFTIHSGKEVRKVNASNPDLRTHPLLYRLAEETLVIYKAEKENNFLDKMSTLSW